MSNASSPTCPRCGALLAAGSVEGLCAKCLGALNFVASAVFSDEGPVAPVPPLRVEELAPHFPQLEILECLGRGGMGVVYKARQKSLNRLVALKLLAPERASHAGFAERFAREAQALAALNHSSIVAVHDFGQAGGFYFLLMEFVDGVNLRQAMNARKFTPEQALAIVPPVCEALQYAHEHGIVHRDIKPENLLLDKEGRVKIADFGVAKMLGDEVSAGGTDSQPAGTPQYMAPEQKEHQRTDHRADIYSLGVVLYEMLTGERPKDNIEPPSRRVQVDVRIDEIVLRALEKTPELRFQTAAEMRTRLQTMAELSPSERQAESSRRPLLIPALLFVTLYAAHICFLISMAPQLPERLATHFDIDGRPNGWMGRTGDLVFNAVFPLFFLVMFWLASQSIKWFPGLRLINIPRRDYWLAPERRAETAAFLFRRFLWVACLLTIFSAGLDFLVIEANRTAPPHLPSGRMQAMTIGFLLALMIWIVTLISRLAEAGHRRPAKRTPQMAAVSHTEPATAPQRLFHAMGYRHPWSQRFLAVSFLGFLGFVGCIPGLERMLVLLWLFAFLVLANLLEQIASRSDASGPIVARNIWRRQWSAAALVLVFALLMRVLLLGQYTVTGNSAAPEIPAGSRILVWKMSRSFAPGDMAAYRQDGHTYVGRVIHAAPGEITFNRNGRPDEAIPRSRVIGKVISVYWRGAATAPSAAEFTEESSPVAAVKVYTGNVDVWLDEAGLVAPPAEGQAWEKSAESLPPPTTGELYTQYTQVSQQLIERQAEDEWLKTTLGPAHPKMKALQAQIQQLQLLLDTIKKQNAGMSAVRPEVVEAASPAEKPVTLLFQIPENYVQTIVRKLDAGEHPRVEAYDRVGEKRIATGKLVGVDSQIDATTGTLPCKAEVKPEPEALLYPNQFVNIRLLAETKTGVTLVPASALQFSSTDPSAFVHVIDSGGYVRFRRVTVGIPKDKTTREITDGLAPDEIVVADAHSLVREGEKLRYKLVPAEDLEHHHPSTAPGSSPKPQPSS